jgi:hypothetical protein
MTLSVEDYQIAKQRASQYAPFPEQSATMVGVYCAVGAAVVLMVFTRLAEIDLERAPFSELIVLVLSFAIPFWYVYPDSSIVRKTACHGAIFGFVMGHDLRRLFVSR